ncbi:MAG: PAS domain S-box protein [bacterium]|nr:PAS domain S-box protein [bacterium]
MDRSKLQKILDAVPDMYFILDGDGVLLDFKPSRTTQPLIPPEQFLEKPLAEVFSHEISEAAMEHVRRVLATGQESRMSYTLPVQGDKEHFEARFIHLDEGEVLVMVRDVTEHRRSDESLRALINASTDMAFLLDREGRIMAINDRAASDYGMKAEKMTGVLYWDLLDGETTAVRRQRFAGVLRTGEPTLALDISRDQVFEVNTNPLHGPDGRVAGVAYFIRDITAKVQADQELIESEARYRHVFEKNPVPMYIYDMDTLMILEVNKAMTVNYGYTRDEMTAMGIKDIRPPEDVKELLKNVSDRRPGQIWLGQRRHLRADGSVIDVETTSSDFPFRQTRARLVLCNDVTEKVRMRKELEQSEERFRVAFETSPDCIVIVDLEKRTIVDVNEEFVSNSGYEKEEVLGRNAMKVGVWADKSDRDRFYEAISGPGSVESFEGDFRTKDGTVKRGLLSARTIDLAGKAHLLIIVRDVTRLMEAREQLKSSLEEKEILLKEIHHRVKNNLQVISGLLDLQAHHITDPLGRAVYKESQNRVITMALIHEELYQSTDLAQVHFGDYIRNLCDNLMISYGVDRERIDLKVDTGKANMVVDTAIPCGLIINELVTNSLKHAFPGDRKGTISISFHTLPDELYELTVSDDGVGIPGDVDIQRTSTLGMRLVTVLVQQLGGTLEIGAGEGTSFTMVFSEYHEAGTVLY